MRYVLDASVAVEYLLRTRLGQSISDMLDSAQLVSPELLDVEILAVLRREVMIGRLDDERAVEALDDLSVWPIERVPHAALIGLAWTYRHNVSAYDAMYVAVGAAFDAPVLTADGPLSRAPSLGVTIQNVRA